jgi:hypothetical protein
MARTHGREWMGTRLLVGGVTAALAALAAAGPARGDDPDRAADLGAQVTGPQVEANGTGGTPALRAQFQAFREQYLARKKEYAEGKTTTALLLEVERFLSQADCDCGATRQERVSTRRSALTRVKEIDEICKKRFAAGQVGRNDLAQVAGQRALAEVQLKMEEGR